MDAIGSVRLFVTTGLSKEFPGALDLMLCVLDALLKVCQATTRLFYASSRALVCKLDARSSFRCALLTFVQTVDQIDPPFRQRLIRDIIV